ncbi:MAG: extracellular solute-binding protein [Bacilli bacterium]|jgi:arabinogalactan oligomer/maltooligosaccharide transport system substrate-binding protein
MFKKRIGFMLAGLALLVTPLVSCGGATRLTLKVWAPTEDKAVMEHIIAEFQKTEAGTGIAFDLKFVKEGDVKTELKKDPEAAADVFALVDDNLTELVKTDNILEIGGAIKTRVTAANDDWTVDAATRNGKLYGFPQTDDNTYFLWYNKSLVTDTEVLKMETLLAAAQTKNLKVEYDVSNAWFGTGLFLAGGGEISVTPPATEEDSDYQNCNFNTAGPVAAAEAAFALKGTYNTTWTRNDNVVAGMTADTPTVAAGVGGTWQYADLLAKLGANLGATKLPTINVGGVDKQLGSFRSAKLVSIKANTLYPNEALAFAEYATNLASQQYRFEQRGIGPSNIEASNLDAVKDSNMLNAISVQNEFGVNQATAVTGSYWNPIGAVGLMIMNQLWTPYNNAQAALNAAVDQLNNV